MSTIIKVVLAKVGMDGHNRGLETLATWLRNSGVEVIHLDRYRTVEEVTMAAIQEDADVIGLSFLGGDISANALLFSTENQQEGMNAFVEK